MNFLFLAHCHLMTTESNITCWASGTSREGWISKMLNLLRTQRVWAPMCVCCISLLMAFICISVCRVSSFQMNVSLTWAPIRLLQWEADAEFLGVQRSKKVCHGQRSCAQLPEQRMGRFPQLFTSKGQEWWTLLLGDKGKAWKWREVSILVSLVLTEVVQAHGSASSLAKILHKNQTNPFSFLCAIFFFFFIRGGKV